jgi:hypothetical protein
MIDNNNSIIILPHVKSVKKSSKSHFKSGWGRRCPAKKVTGQFTPALYLLIHLLPDDTTPWLVINWYHQ